MSKAKISCNYEGIGLKNTSEDGIQKSLEEGLEYNEYEYQTEKKILIKEPFRAEGLHKPLYICKKCGSKYNMTVQQ